MRSIHSSALIAVLLAASAACADRNSVTGGTTVIIEPPGPATQLRCTADVRAGTLECAPAVAPGVRGDLIVGGQDVYVKLRSSGVAFAPSGPGGILSATVSLQNLLAQPMGTTDGTTPSPTGTRIFFASGPTVTAGTGTVTVLNPTGTAAFLSGSQPYFQYDGIIAPGATSGGKPWQFDCAAGVVSFAFTVYVSAPLPKESGWVTITEPNLTIAPGQTVTLSATVHNGSGSASADDAVTWGSSDDAIASVTASGDVTAHAPGTVTITATNGSRTGTTSLTVAAVDVTAPTLTGVSISPDPVAAGDSVTFAVSASDAGTGVSSATVQAVGPAGPQTFCTGFTPSSGTRASGTFTCKAPIRPGAAAGTWTISSITLDDGRGNSVRVAGAQVAAGGFTVTDPAPDATAPVLTGFALSPTSVNAGDSVTVTATAMDAGTGVAQMSAFFRDPSGQSFATCRATTPATGTANSGTFVCKAPFAPGTRPGTWTVTAVRLADATGNATFKNTSELAVLGFPTTVAVTSATPDTTAPTIGAVSFAPAPATLADSVTVTVGMADAGTGVSGVEIVFRTPTTNQMLQCVTRTPASGTTAFGTYTCRFGFKAGWETGTWTLLSVAATDLAGNYRQLDTGDLQALGYETTLTVNP